MKFTTANVEERQKLNIRTGDTVRVWQKITEYIQEKDKVKEKVRSQAFEGLVLARKHGNEAGARFTVRKVVDGIGVEKIFPLYATTIEKIEILKTSQMRRAKLYHIRRKAAKEIRRQMRREIAVKDTSIGAEKVESKTEDKKETAV